MSKVAVIGLGVMGRGMAANLLKHGHEVSVWNRSPARVEEFVAQGARSAAGPGAAAAAAEVVFEVTADDASSRAVWLGPEGILAGAAPETVLITSATLSVPGIEELAAATGERKFLDMPLTGGQVAADSGNLILLAGGDLSHLDPYQDVVDAIASQVKHFGPVGAGTKFKLILNSLQAIHLTAFGELMHVAERAGLDPAVVGPALAERPGGVLTQLAWSTWDNIPEPASFAANWMSKDLNYAAQFGGPHPYLDRAREILQQAVDQGHGETDWTVVNLPADRRP